MDRTVDFLQYGIVKVHSSQIEELKKNALRNTHIKRYRLCFHDDPANKQQEMLICVAKGDYSRPHKHIGISETHTIIEGRVLVVLFDDYGKIKDKFLLDRMGEYLSCRINDATYHMNIPLTETAITYEVKPGPFTPKSNVYPDWAPDGSNKEECDNYVESILEASFY